MRSLALLAAASAIALTGAVAYAQPSPPPAGGAGPGAGPRSTMTRSDFDALTDARIAGIKAGLKLTTEQQALWTPVEQALRDMATTRAQRFEDMRQRREARQAGPRERPDMMQMLEQRSEWASQSADSLKAMATAMKPFWASLNDQQKKLLPILMRPEGGGPRRSRDHGRMGGMMQHQSGPMGQGGGQQNPAPSPQ
jgi:zinc resistance-associated protein